MNVLRQQPREVSEDEERAIREDIDEWLLSSNGHTNGKRLHIPHTDRPLCETLDEKTTTVPTEKQKGTEFMSRAIAVYPLGYRDICRLCGHVWREEGL